MAIPPSAYSEDFKFYGRGHVDSSNPVFGDEFLRLLINGDKGTIVDVISHYGIVVIRMDLKEDPICDVSKLIICYTGKISDLKNVDHPNIGSDLSLKINLQNNTWTLAIKSGNMEGTNVLVYLENMDKENKMENGNLRIDWRDCAVERELNSNNPQTLKIIPYVLDESGEEIKTELNSKFRFSLDNNKSEISHTHLDNKLIEEFVISSNDPLPIILNLTKAIHLAEEQHLSQIQVESRHYTIFPPPEKENISYNNDDQILLEFIHENGVWNIHNGLCKNISIK